MRHDLGQLLLVVRRVKGPVERGPLDLAAQTLLQLGHRRHHQVLIQHAIGHHLVMADETSGILDHQHLVTILDRVGLLAPLDQFRVRLEDAENLLLVGHRFAQQHTPPGRAAHFLRQLHIMPAIPLAARQAVAEPIDARAPWTCESQASAAVGGPAPAGPRPELNNL